MKKRNPKFSDGAAAIAGIAAIAVIVSLANVLMHPSISVASPPAQMDPISVIEVSHHNEPVPSVSLDGESAEPSLTEQYAHKLGYRNWNEYVEKRPANKMGKRVVDDPVHVIEGAPTFADAANDPESIFYTDSAIPDPAGDGRELWKEPVSPQIVYRDLFASGGTVVETCAACCITDPVITPPPSVSVPEPAAIWLLVTGVAGLFSARRVCESLEVRRVRARA